MSNKHNVFTERALSVGSDRELDDIANLHSFSSVNFKNQQLVEADETMYGKSSYDSPGFAKPPHHESSTIDDDEGSLSQPSASAKNSPERKIANQWSFDASDSPKRQSRPQNVESPEHKGGISKLPRLIKEESNISTAELRSPRYSNRENYEGIELNETDPFNGEYQASGKDVRKSGSSTRKKSKKHKSRSSEDIRDELYEETRKLKKKKKHKRHGGDSLTSTATYTVEAFANQGYVSDKLPPKPERKKEDTVSLDSNGTYVVDRSESDNEESGFHLKESLRSVFKRASSTIKLTDDKRPKTSKKILSCQKKTAKFISENIKQRECCRYARDFDCDKYGCLCGRDADWHVSKSIHVDKKMGKEVWHPKTHTESLACDSFGEITFRGFGHDTTNSPYVRLQPTTELKDVWEILINYWGLPVPKLLISVTGGAKKFELKTRLRTVLKQGLIHAATSTGAWIVTGGTAAGVMEFVGEAVRDHIFSTGNPQQNRVVALGVASWGVINNKLALDGEGSKGLFPAVYAVEDTVDVGDGTPLDHNHTHFMLVDNGTDGKYGGEIEFRSHLESYISQKVETGVATTQSVHVPCVLIVVEGGINTMKTVLETLRRKTPVVVIAGTGRCADLIAFGFKLSKIKYNEEESKHSKGNDETMKTMAKQTFFGGKSSDKINKQVAELIRDLNEILEDRRLINVFSMERADMKEIDRAILYALLKANKSDAKSQLALALAWNRCDIARQEIFTTENRQKWGPTTLYNAMVTALVQDRTDFVQVFLDNGVDFHKFLTKETLWNLYSLTTSDTLDTNGDVLRHLIGYIKQTWLAFLMCKGTETWENSANLLCSVSKVLVHLMKDSAMNIYKGADFNVSGLQIEMKWMGNKDTLKCMKSRITQQNLLGKKGKKVKKKLTESYDFENPARELFIWAVLFNRRSMAHLFWKLGTDQLGGAVVACSLLKAMAEVAEQEEELELSADLYEHSGVFEKLATNVLAECYSKDKKMAQLLLTREQILWGNRTLFQIAENNTMMDFLEHSCCQTKLNTVWKGAMALYTSEFKICVCILCPILLPFIKFSTHKSLEDIIDDDEDEDDDDDDDVINDDSNRPPSGNKVVPGTSNLNDKFTPSKSRRGKAVKKRTYTVDYCKCDRNNVNILSALVFFYSAPVTKFYTSLLAYLVFLGIFTYFVLIDLRPVSLPDSPSIHEYITWVWLTTMVIEELRQIIILDQPPLYKIRNWFGSIWNRFDSAMYVLFLASVVLRFTIFTSDFLWARISYSITLAMFYLRLMQSFFISKNMGPKVIMIERMLTDLFFFFLILLVFILSFGIAYQANLFPNSEPSWVILKNILYLPYWQMYGELFLERIEGEEPGCTNNKTIWSQDISQRCPDSNAFVPVLLAIYMILTNILLVNLLIAMFSYTFQTIQDNSLKVWRFYRLSLVQELFDRPALVPPLIILNHMYRFIIYVINKSCGDIIQSKNDFKVKLMKEENLRLSLFERGAMENYLSHSLMKEKELLGNKVSSTADRIEMVMDELAQIKDTITEQDTVYTGTNNNSSSAVTDRSVVAARPTGADEVAYLRQCIDDLSEQMGTSNFKLNQMMHLLEDILKTRKHSHQSMDMEIEDVTQA